MSQILCAIVTFFLAILVLPQLGMDGLTLVQMAMADDDDDGPLLRLGIGSDDDDDGPRRVRRPAVADDDDDDDDDRRVIRRRAPAPAAAPLPRRAPAEILARGLTAEELSGLEQQGFTLLERHELSSGQPLMRLRKPERLTMRRARQVVRELASPARVDFNHYYRSEQAETCRSVDCLARQTIAWPVVQQGCGPLPAIGIVDTGLNAEHAALSDANIHVHRIDSGNTVAASGLLHGTAVASLLVGDADSRSPGLIPRARLVAVDAFHKNRKDERADAFALIQALDYLSQQGVRVVNLSLAGPPNATLGTQITRMAADDIVLVAAAGNYGPSAKPAYPAAYDPVIAVTAVDRRGQIYRRANRGAHIDLAAPGVNVWTAASISGARTKTGTSFAAPFVTAAAALLLQNRPGLSAAEVSNLLLKQARDLGSEGHDNTFGHGLLTPPESCRTPATGTEAG